MYNVFRTAEITHPTFNLIMNIQPIKIKVSMVVTIDDKVTIIRASNITSKKRYCNLNTISVTVKVRLVEETYAYVLAYN